MTDILVPGAESEPLDAPSAGRRDRKKLATRQALRLAAYELVAARGYANVTVEDIAEAADVSPRTFFNYFASKEAVLVSEDPERIAEVLQLVLDQPPSTAPLQALRHVMVEKAMHIDAEAGAGSSLWLLRCQAMRDEPQLRAAHAAQNANLERQLTEAIARRLGADLARDPYPAIVVASVMATMRSVIMHWGTQGGNVSLIDLTEQAFDTLAAGLKDERPPRSLSARARRRASSTLSKTTTKLTTKQAKEQLR